MFRDVYKGKKVLVSGHTGFKGSWLCSWLIKLGAEVHGFSLDIPTKPSIFEMLGLRNRLTDIQGDIRNEKQLLHTMQNLKPDIVFHLAAQSLVRRSFSDPRTTFETNVTSIAVVVYHKAYQILAAMCRTSLLKNVRFILIPEVPQCTQDWIWGSLSQSTQRRCGHSLTQLFQKLDIPWLTLPFAHSVHNEIHLLQSISTGYTLST